jgi:hypothetical protein
VWRDEGRGRVCLSWSTFYCEGIVRLISRLRIHIGTQKRKIGFSGNHCSSPVIREENSSVVHGTKVIVKTAIYTNTGII